MKTVNYLGNDLTRSSNGNSTMPNKRTELTDNTYNILGLYLVFPVRWQSGQNLSQKNRSLLYEAWNSIRAVRNMALGVLGCFDSLKEENTKGLRLWLLHLVVGVISLNRLNIDSIFLRRQAETFFHYSWLGSGFSQTGHCHYLCLIRTTCENSVSERKRE